MFRAKPAYRAKYQGDIDGRAESQLFRPQRPKHTTEHWLVY
jgi:hypothetical protein